MRSVHRVRGGRALRGFRTRLELLEERQCLSITVTSVDLEDGTELRITGNGDDDTINVADSGDGHVDVTDGGGAPLGSADDVVRISLDAGGGHDVVNYSLTAPLTTDQSLLFRLGEGADQADLDLSAGITNAGLRIHVDGGAGDDTVSATVGPLSAAHVGIHVIGQGGNDQLSINGAPVVPPSASIAESEDSSDDDGESSLVARLWGGWGDDTLALNLGGATADDVYVDLNGGAGDDNLSASVTGGPVPEATADSLSEGEEEHEEDEESDEEPSLRIRLDGGLGDDALSASVGGAASGYVKLQLNGGSGDDDLSLMTLGEDIAPHAAVAPESLNSDHPHHGEPSMDARLYGGGGDDTLGVTLGSVGTPYVKLDLDGGSGDDLLTLLATGANIAEGASLHAKLYGGSGDDTINGTFDGQILGALMYSAFGGPGDDTLASNLTATAGSTGMLCAASAGGSGTDNVTLNVFDNSGDGGASLLALLHAKIFDPGGHDTLVHSDNVEVILNNGKGKDDDIHD